MKIYVACLESYNEGNLVGEWVDLSEVNDAEELKGKIHGIIRGEEYAIHDYEDCPEELVQSYGEHATLEDLMEAQIYLQECIDNYDSDIVYAAFDVEVISSNYDPPEEWPSKLSERYVMSGESQREIAMERAVDTGEIDPESPMFGFIDWDHYVSEMRHDYAFAHAGGKYHLFAGY